MKSRVDKASKAILKGANIRAGIVKYLIPDYSDLTINDIKALMSEPLETADTNISDKEIRYDVLFTMQLPGSKETVGIYIDLEPQGYYQSDAKLMSRAWYYCSRMIARQKNDGEMGFTGNDYGKLKKVYSVWIITDKRSQAKRKGKEYSFELMQTDDNEERMEKSLYQKASVMLLYPNNMIDENSSDILRMLSIVFNGNRGAKEKANMLKSSYQIEVDNEEETAMFGFLDEHEEEHEKQFNAAKKKAREEGLAEGRAEGRAEGKAEGRTEGRAEMISQLMKNMNISIEKAFEMFDLSEEEKTVIKDIIMTADK